MTAPKSDNATIQARQSRFLELRSEGNTEARAAEILRQEGYPASLPTIRRDVTVLAPVWEKTNQTAFEQCRQEALHRLDELAEEADNRAIKAERRVELKHAILVTRAKILGIFAPIKTSSANVNVTAEYSQDYLEYKAAFAGLTDDERQEELSRVRARPRTWQPPMLDASYFPPVRKALPSAAELADPVDEEDFS